MTKLPKLVVAFAVLAASCARHDRPEGFFAGSAKPELASPACPASRATLQIRGEVVIFVPDEGTWVLQGVLAADNTITADRSQIGVNKQVYETAFEGRRTGDAVAGTYTTPKCRFRVALARR